MTCPTKRPPRIPNGTRVHVRSDHFTEECDARITQGEYDGGWLYRIEVTGGQAPEACRNQEGELWVYAQEVHPLA